MIMVKRLRKIIARLEKQGLNYALISKPENINYVVGFRTIGTPPKTCYLLLSQREPKARLLVTSLDYDEAVEALDGKIEVVKMAIDPPIKTLSKILRERCVLGVELNYVSNLLVEKLKASMKDVEIKDFSNQVEEERAVKDLEEVEVIKKSIEIAESSLKKAINFLVEGVSERELAIEFEYEAKKNGAEGLAFDTIVASGHHSAYPHWTSSDKKLRKGEAVIIDVGVRFRGYCSDLARTVFLNKVHEKLNRAYFSIIEARREALERLRSGAMGCSLDREVRKSLRKKGFTKEFIHGLGHGVGLSIHEKPTLARRSLDRLKIGQVFTLEPGLYFKGMGGVRIEDMYLLHSKGVQKLTSFEDIHVLT